MKDRDGRKVRMDGERKGGKAARMGRKGKVGARVVSVRDGEKEG